MTADDRVRGFPAFPPGRRGRRARSWWGGAWVRAMEDTSLDRELLTKGRRYAYAGHVGSITVSPGRLAAAVHDGDQDTAYRTRVFVERLTDAQWTRFLDQVAAKAGHLAALLDGEMPHDLVTAADDAGVRLLPGLGDLRPECDCPDWGHPCRHAAALCYQAAWLLDADPFVLLLLRGRGPREFLAGLHRRDAARRPPEPERAAAAPAAAGGARRVPGTPARQAYADPVGPLPAPPPPPGASPPWPPVELPGHPGIDPAALRLLAENAAALAGDLLARARAGTADRPLDRWSDAVRPAAGQRDAEVSERLCRPTGRSGAAGPPGGDPAAALTDLPDG